LSLEELGIEVLKLSNEDLIFSDNLYDLDMCYHFFLTKDFDFWCETSGVSEETKIIIKKNVEIKYDVLKYVLSKNNGKDYYLKDGCIIINTCTRRVLYIFEDIIDYLKPVRIDKKVGLRLNFEQE
jgi:hypothetical protein